MTTTGTITIGTRIFTETKSDTYMIRKVGTEEIYSSAVDIVGAGFEHIETDAEFEVGTSTTIIPNVAQIKTVLGDIDSVLDAINREVVT